MSDIKDNSIFLIELGCPEDASYSYIKYITGTYNDARDAVVKLSSGGYSPKSILISSFGYKDSVVFRSHVLAGLTHLHCELDEQMLKLNPEQMSEIVNIITLGSRAHSYSAISEDGTWDEN